MRITGFIFDFLLGYLINFYTFVFLYLFLNFKTSVNYEEDYLRSNFLTFYFLFLFG